MKALLLYPQFPQSFWSYDRFMEIAGLKAVLPPLGIITVAALLPQSWEIKFCDRNVNLETEADWEWCDLVILSAMLVQKPDFHSLIQKAVRLVDCLQLFQVVARDGARGPQGTNPEHIIVQ